MQNDVTQFASFGTLSVLEDTLAAADSVLQMAKADRRSIVEASMTSGVDSGSIEDDDGKFEENVLLCFCWVIRQLRW